MHTDLLRRFDVLLQHHEPTRWQQAVELARAMPEAAQRQLITHRLGDPLPARLSPQACDLFLLLSLRRRVPRVRHLDVRQLPFTVDLRTFPNLLSLDTRSSARLIGPHPQLQRLTARHPVSPALLASPRLHTLHIIGGQISRDMAPLPALRHLSVVYGAIRDLHVVAPHLRSLAVSNPQQDLAALHSHTAEALAIYQDTPAALQRARFPELRLLISGCGPVTHDLRCAWIDAHSGRWDTRPDGLILPSDQSHLWALADGPEAAIRRATLITHHLWAFSRAPRAWPALQRAVREGRLHPNADDLTHCPVGALLPIEANPEVSLALCMKGALSAARLERFAERLLFPSQLEDLEEAFSAAGEHGAIMRAHWQRVSLC